MRFGRVGTCVAASGAYLIFRIATSYVRLGHLNHRLALFLAGASVIIFMLVQLAVVVGFVGMQIRLKSALMIFLGSAAVFVGILLLPRTRPSEIMVVLGLVSQLSLVLLAISLGYMVSFIVREPNILLPAAVCAAFVDYWNVTMGPLGQMLEKRPDIVEKVAVHVPAMATGMPLVMIGMGDIVFLALFFGVLFRFSMNVNGAFWLGFILLTISLFVAMLGIPIPALVPMGIAILAANARHFKLKREELFATLYVGIFLLILLIASAIFMLKR